MRVSIPGRVPLDLVTFLKLQDIDISSIQLSWRLHDKDRGYVLRSETQTLRRSLQSSRCHFCIYQSAIGDKIEREKLECKHKVYRQHTHFVLCRHNCWSIFFSLVYNVEVHLLCFC